MGIEYKVRFKKQTAAQVDSFLRSLPCFASFDEKWDAYNYRENENTSTMPNAEIRIEPDGLYLCDYGMSRHLFGLLVKSLIANFGSIQIEDYES